MEQTRNKDDAMRKNTRLNTRKGRVQKNLLRKKRRKFCIWFDMKEKIRKRRKLKTRGMRSRTKEREEK